MQSKRSCTGILIMGGADDTAQAKMESLQSNKSQKSKVSA
jgi:hypothetical protein